LAVFCCYENENSARSVSRRLGGRGFGPGSNQGYQAFLRKCFFVSPCKSQCASDFSPACRCFYAWFSQSLCFARLDYLTENTHLLFHRVVLILDCSFSSRTILPCVSTTLHRKDSHLPVDCAPGFVKLPYHLRLHSSRLDGSHRP
jgi:hypothetical protein